MRDSSSYDQLSFQVDYLTLKVGKFTHQKMEGERIPNTTKLNVDLILKSHYLSGELFCLGNLEGGKTNVGDFSPPKRKKILDSLINN